MTGPNGIWAQNLRAAEWEQAGAKLAAREAADEARIGTELRTDGEFGRPRNDPNVKKGNQQPDDPTYWILHAASAIHVALNLLNGFGNPEPGDGLTQGTGVFRDASAILRAAGSDPGWQGAAAQSYNARNTEQQARTNQMAALDTQLAGLLQTQADEVQALRVNMGLASMILFPTGYLAAAAAFVEGGNVASYSNSNIVRGRLPEPRWLATRSTESQGADDRRRN